MGVDRSGAPTFALDVEACDGWTRVAVSGELDLATVDPFSGAVRDGLAAGAVVIDLRDVSFMDSAGVRALNTALREAAGTGRELRVAEGMQPIVRQVLEITGMLGLLQVGDAP
jgi:anti-sigma B factor antagonist